MSVVRVLDNAPWLTSGPTARVLELLNGNGEEARVVGGAVRNALLKVPTGDIDIATTAVPEEVNRRAKAAGIKSVPTGIEHGTVTLVVDGHAFEVTTLREDTETFGRRAHSAAIGCAMPSGATSPSTVCRSTERGAFTTMSAVWKTSRRDASASSASPSRELPRIICAFSASSAFTPLTVLAKS